MKAKGEDMSAAAPSLEELLSGVSRKTADAPGGGPGRLGPPPEEEENFDEVEETVIERLVGLTEMVPDPLWNVGEKGLRVVSVVGAAVCVGVGNLSCSAGSPSVHRTAETRVRGDAEHAEEAVDVGSRSSWCTVRSTF
ncbi:hypothetical protein GBAR_LOCUS19448 [Geodia barretti]|uniref:Uncharacterized protein n=1 Tax=Geodia barretti TaxID=519541 RepID=A0AA35WZM8_GEOBA|nr:hypothetical protein GBAR_LOCUS19448 [Geodia barretti]